MNTVLTGRKNHIVGRTCLRQNKEQTVILHKKDQQQKETKKKCLCASPTPTPRRYVDCAKMESECYDYARVDIMYKADTLYKKKIPVD